ncbi:MAG: hypothetical protein KDA68_13505, partial [Planctomycetaceae bacterium]|nr:hypothetical protein [Planctomycetaceae bacterium]
MLIKNWLARYRAQWAGRPLLTSRRRPTAVPVARIERCEERTLLSATLVKDINPGKNYSSIGSDSLVIGNTLYFQANDGTTSYELWKSDGTTAGTVQVKDINPGANGSGPNQFINLNGTLYFVAWDGTHGSELWKSDGTSAGTVMVKDIYPGSEGGNITSLVLVGSHLYFSAWSGTGDYGIWKSDGTEAGTTVVKSFADVYDNQVAQSVIEVVELNGKALFSVRHTASQNGIWITDGTEAGTTLLSANGGQHTDADFGLTKVGNSVFFTRQVSPVFARHLWKTDGTVAGTVLVKADMPYISRGLDVNGKLIYLTLNDTLTVSDGTSAGTFSLSSSVPGFEKYFRDMVVFNNLLYFQDGTKLWKTDGTTAGTVIADPDVTLGNWPGYIGSQTIISSIRVAGGQLFFTAYDTIRGLELYRSNGLPGGSEIVADINPGSGTGVGSILSANSTSLFLSAGDPLTFGNELYKVPLVESVVNNAAPVLDPAGNPTLDSVVEETPAVNNPGTLVSTIVSRMTPGGITDPDSGAQIGIAIIGANQVTGAWQYSLNNGASWNYFGTTSLATSLLLAADASTRVRYLPNYNFAGSPGFTFVAWDRTTGAEGEKVPTTIRGGTTAFSLAAEDAFITVTNTQDAPFLNQFSTLKLPDLNEDTPSASNAGTLISTLITSYTSGTGITDPDPGAGKGIALVGIDQTNGLWQFSTNNGTSWTNVGSPGPTAALLLAADSNTRLRFLPNLNYFGSAGFNFFAWDQTAGTNG